MNFQELLKKTEDHVNLFYLDHTDANLFYHNQSHASEVPITGWTTTLFLLFALLPVFTI
jgi:hypothetical protein